MDRITLLIGIAAAVKFAIHMLTGARYGLFVDELYAIALSKHLAWGYVDVPPLAPALLALSRLALGESITAIHFLPALAGAITLVFACRITLEFGGRAVAVALTALSFLAASPWLVINSFYSYDAFDQLLLILFLYVLIRFLRSGKPALWVWMGVLAGLACLTKMTLLYLGPGFLVALLLSKYRAHLRTPWPWLGAGLCVLIMSPYLLWQVENHWPTLEYWMNYGTTRLYQAPPGEYAFNLVWDLNPALLPVHLFGLWRIFRRFEGRDYRFLGVMFIVSLVLMFFLHARTWMLAALFLPLIAAGAVGLEELARRARWGKLAAAAAAAVVLAGGLAFAPVNLPIVPLENLPAFRDRYPLLFRQPKVFVFDSGNYPTHLALRIGWEEVVKKVSVVYNNLPPEERQVAGIFAGWYGPASAIDYFGPQYGLPNAVSGHLTYYLWGPGNSWDVMIIAMSGGNGLAPLFSQCEMKGRALSEFTVPFNQLNLYVCRKPNVSTKIIWPMTKSYQ